MQTAARSSFITVKTEGGILPADLLQRIADGSADGLSPTDYHLAASERLNEAINRSWNRLLGVWQAFQHKMEQAAPSETGTTMTREWVLTVLQELGYGRLPYQGKLTIGDTDYPISHLYDHTPIHLVTFRQKLESPDRSQAAKRSPHSLLQECLNRSDNHLWGFVSNGLRLRILRDNVSLTRVAYVEFDLEAMFDGELYADFTLLWLLCHQSRVEVGATRRREQAEDGAEAAPVTRSPLPSDCWLERWSQQAADQGARALDALRDGVQEAIAALGRGFLAHPANHPLKEALQSGALSTQDYYRQLLRLVYRLLFLFVAEDRELLLLPETPAAVREQYDAYYSVSRLRRLAESRRGGLHPDLYYALAHLFSLLRIGYEPLGLPGLGSFLFSERATPDLDTAHIANQDLLAAVRVLAFTTEGKVRRPVDYKNLGSEEFGSVYESLLELQPKMHLPSASFTLDVTAGSERKTTGSYYTDTSLIQSLLDSALEPVIAGRLEQAGRGLRPYSQEWQAACEKALLAIKVVDLASGSGHFLIGAARRLARHLARIRTGDDEPGPEAVRRALRDVVAHCIYGVDINEMAVELCKVALWMETLDPGRPLSFLDAKIQCGNSLIGATPALLERGIPDEAFTPITGDDKAYCREWKKRNKQEREGQQPLFTGNFQPWEQLGNLATALTELEALPDETAANVEQQRLAYEALVSSTDYEFSKLWADAWCAAFVWEKKPEREGGWAQPLTDAIFRKLGRNPTSEKGYWEEIRQLAEQYQFFHWHLAFPQVFTPREDLEDENDVSGWLGGFDVVLGNPPWERIKLQEKEWFASRDEAIATAPNAAARRRLIAQLPKTNPALHEAFEMDKRKAEGESHFVRNSGRYPLCGRGDVNTYAIFAELNRSLLADDGRAGFIIQSDIATADTYKYFFAALLENKQLVSFYDFVNTEGLFPHVHRTHPHFCLITLSGGPTTELADFAFWNTNTSHLQDENRHFTLSAADLALLNPNTRTCPIFRSKRDAELTKAIYRRVPVLIKEGPPEENPWGINFLRMFDMSNDSGLFHTRQQLEAEGWRLVGNRFVRSDGFSRPADTTNEEEPFLPLYEAKMLHHFDHRWATYEGLETRDVTPTEKNDPTLLILPRYWVRREEVDGRLDQDSGWLLGFRDITNTTNERTAIFSILPKAAVGNNAPLALLPLKTLAEGRLLAASLSSFAFDFIARFSVGGTHMNFFILKQLPVLTPQTYHQPCPWQSISNSQSPILNPQSPISNFLLPRILELTYTAYDLRPFAQDCGYHGPPFRWDEERRFLLRCELDAAYFHLYGIERDDVDYIMDTFPIVRRKDEAEFGEYRTKRVILEIYDEMAQAMRASGDAEMQRNEYQTRLDPPPAHPNVAHPWDEEYLGPELPKEQWWQEVELHELVVSEKSKTTVTSPRSIVAVKGSAPVLELKSPSLQQPQPKAKTPAQTEQPAPITDFTPPEGSRSQRLKQVMALGDRVKANRQDAAAVSQLVAALGDSDDSIRWLAGSALGFLGGSTVVKTLVAFLEQAETPEARQEAIKALQRIAANPREEEGIRKMAEQASG